MMESLIILLSWKLGWDPENSFAQFVLIILQIIFFFY